MAGYTQANRPLSITTPLGPDALLLEKLRGTEALSELFHFRLDLLAPQPVDFDQVLGQKAAVTLDLANGTRRHVSGIVSRFSQGPQIAGPDGRTTLLRYRAELVPALWLLTRRVQSRIFQRRSVSDILKQILHDEWRLDVTFQLATLPARNYCVQYLETDFAFVSRLMEDEGIFYYFTHDADGHRLYVTDGKAAPPALPEPRSVVYDPVTGGLRDGPRVHDWEKTQEIRACKHTLWDYCFEMPASNLAAQAESLVPEQVTAGQVRHRLNHPRPANGTELLEVYEYPGGYGHRFDGISKEGNPQPNELQQLFTDNARVARLRMEEAAARCLVVQGGGDAGHFLPGHTFTLARHFDADGDYLLTRVEHTASLEGAYTTAAGAEPVYANRFECLPAGLPFRPARVTPRPKMEGTQTAVVVGPAGQEVFVDKYGRVKVQFRWDRQGTKDANSSCWLRVAQPWAGKCYGTFFWPRVGHEVAVAFEDGDPDRPHVLGSFYNADNLPPAPLPDRASVSGIKSCSLGGTPAANYNAICFHDESGGEHLEFHSENHEVHNAETSQHAFVPEMDIRVVGNLLKMLGLGGLSGGGGGGEPGSGSGGGLGDYFGSVASQTVFGMQNTAALGGSVVDTFGRYANSAYDFVKYLGDTAGKAVQAVEGILTMNPALFGKQSGTNVQKIGGNHKIMVDGEYQIYHNGVSIDNRVNRDAPETKTAIKMLEKAAYISFVAGILSQVQPYIPDSFGSGPVEEATKYSKDVLFRWLPQKLTELADKISEHYKYTQVHEDTIDVYIKLALKALEEARRDIDNANEFQRNYPQVARIMRDAAAQAREQTSEMRNDIRVYKQLALASFGMLSSNTAPAGVANPATALVSARTNLTAGPVYLNGDNVNIVSKGVGAADAAAVNRRSSWVRIHAAATGGGTDDGQVNIRGDTHVKMHCGGNAQIVVDQTKGKETILLQNRDVEGAIRLMIGHAKIEMTDTHLLLSMDSTHLKLSADGITLWKGAREDARGSTQVDAALIIGDPARVSPSKRIQMSGSGITLTAGMGTAAKMTLEAAKLEQTAQNIVLQATQAVQSQAMQSTAKYNFNQGKWQVYQEN